MTHDQQSSGAPSRPWLRWLILAPAAIGVGFLFLWGPGGKENAATSSRRGGRVTPVATAPVEIGSLTERATYPGELDADAADVASNVGGRLVEVHIRIGDEVKKGQELARIEVSELSQQREAALAEASAAAAAAKRTSVQLEAARRELERARGMRERELISEQQLESQRDQVVSLEAGVEVARAQHAQARARVEVLDQRRSESRVRAPLAGVVTERHFDPGTFVQPGEPLVRLVAREPLRVSFEVPEQAVGRFGADASFVVRAPPTGDLEVTGTVTGVAAEVERQKRIVRVEGAIDDPPASWLPGMYAEVVASLGTLEGATIVPDRALVSRLRGGGEVQLGVFQPHQGTARWVPVEVVARDGERAAVEGELDAEREVLVGGHTDLSDGARIRISAEDAT